MSNFVISPATSGDIPALNRLVNSAYRGEGSRRGWTTEADLLSGIRTTEASLAELLANPNALILRYVVEDELVGCVYLEYKENTIYLGMLTVAPNAQAGGIGRQLLEAAEEYARDRQCRAITMTVIPLRTELLAWYERRGYERTGIELPFPNDPARFGTPNVPLSFIELRKEING